MELINLIKKLLSIKSVTGEENQILLELEKIVSKTDLSIKRIPVNANRWNLLIEKKGNFRGVLFCGHIDTVPSKFSKPNIKDEFLYGLGSSDMKSAIGVMLKSIIEDKSEFKHGLLITVGEEKSTFDGIQKAIKSNLIQKFKLAILGEPTNLEVKTKQFGLAGIELEFKSVQRHATMLKKGNHPMHDAIFVTNKLIQRFNFMNFKSLLGINNLTGGIKGNMIPGKIIVTIDVRVHPDESLELMEDFFTKELSKTKWRKRNWLSPVNNGKESFKEILNWIDIPKVGILKGFSEMFFLDSIGIKTVVFGPGLIEEAHKKNEKIPIKNIKKYCQIIKRIMKG